MARQRATFQPPAPAPLPDGSTPPAANDAGESPTPRADALPPGTKLEEFRIERVIGHSGFGVVYLAHDEAFDRRVALKEYLPDTLAMRSDDGAQVMLRASTHADAFERGRRAFLEEAQLLARCQHPSLLHVLRSWEANGTVYRAMPYYPGTSLQTLRQAMTAPPDEASLRALLDGLLDALQALHEAGALHREISPANILLLPDDRPVLLDSSAARRAIVGEQARALMTLLSPSFAPLEQTAPSPDRPQGPWTDLYALGAVVKYCISGELPPPASLYRLPPRESTTALAHRMRARFPLLHFSTSFLRAIDATLALDPEDRPHSVMALREMLEDHPPARSDASETQPLPSTEEATMPERREPVFGPQPTSDDEPAMGTGADNTTTRIDMAPGVPSTPIAPPAPALNQRASATQPTATPEARAAAAAPVMPAAMAAGGACAEPTMRSAPRSSVRPPPEWARPLEDRLAAGTGGTVFSFAEQARRRRRRVAWTSTLLLLVAAGAVAWLADQERLVMLAQTAFARAVRHDRLTANVPAVPAVSDTSRPAAEQAQPAAPTVTANAATAASEPAPLPQAPTAAVAAPAATEAAATTTSTLNASGTGRAATTESAPANDESATTLPVTTASAEKAAPESEPEVTAPPPARARTPARHSSSLRSAAMAPSHSGAAAKSVERAAPRPAGPREACGDRTQFSLYRCMKTQCAQPQWAQHPSCKLLRLRDEVE